MREFGIKRGERELQAANADEIDTLLTMLKLRDDWQGREMAWWLQWILLKAEARKRRGGALVLTSPPNRGGKRTLSRSGFYRLDVQRLGRNRTARFCCHRENERPCGPVV